ncbi:MAG: translation initiation factor IF-2 [Patescibacteria group bacterium]|nr:translation initiation factor IF-2 [Patescibacteria group bacterium]
MMKKNYYKSAKRRQYNNQPTVDHHVDSLNTEKKVTSGEEETQKKPVEIPQIITVREFAVLLELPITAIITELMKNGVMASINESIDFDTAAIVADELGFEARNQKSKIKNQKELTTEEKKQLKSRPPVIVVMGHVDHGKTKLLDSIRKTDVVSTESGGITQHIGAYQTTWQSKDKKKHLLTFLDTPGHAAFSAMRAHGANITDIAILVVAADDGVKPQTKEAISHAKAANIPIIVAINKIDKPTSDVEKVKRQLADLDLSPEEWGGKTVMVPISAKEGKNIDKLLDMVILTAQMAELKAIKTGFAEGVVIESHMQAGVGPVATILVQKGKLQTGDALVIGQTYGKVRLMEDFRGKRISEALPSTPVKIAGLHDVPNFGDFMQVMADERQARNAVAVKTIKRKVFGLAEVSEEAQEGKLTELNIIVKADTQGSLGAIKTSLESISESGVQVKIVNDGVGDVNESDINIAISSKAIILGFKIKLPPAVKKFADEKGIKISLYDIIYNLLDDVTAAVKGLIKQEFVEVLVGKLEVLKVFHSTRGRKVVGGKVVDGQIEKGLKVHLYHSGDQSGDGVIVGLQKEQNQVEVVEKGFECGLAIETTTVIKPTDIIECYKIEEKLRK